MRVLKASWEITRRCNANCAHCYVDGSHNLGELKNEDVDIVLSRLYEGGVRFLTFSGGEPCVAPNFDHVINRAIKIGFTCKIITNGTIPRRDLIEKNRDGKLDTIISILAGTTDAFTKTYRLDSNLFENQCRILKELKTFSVNIPMFSANSAPEIIDGIATYLAPFRDKICDVSVFSATPIGRGIADGCFEINALHQELTRRMIGRLADVGILADFNLDCSDSGSCPLIGATVPREIFINPRGQIRPCHGLVGYETNASLLEASLSELLSSSAMQRWKCSDKRFAFDHRCKASLMQSKMHAGYVQESGGAEAFKEVEIQISPDLVLEQDAGTWYGYLRNAPSLLELNEDAYTLIMSIERGEWRVFVETLDEEELAAVIEVVLEAEITGLLSINRPVIRPGPLLGQV